LFVAMAFVGLWPSSATAQEDSSHWGVGVSFTPKWSAHDTLRTKLLGLGSEDDEGDLEGSEFTIGVVRGSVGGGEWGVSYVRRPFENGTTLIEREPEECFNDQFVNSCSRSTFTRELQDVFLQGVEWHMFIPFVRVAERVQIGVNVAAGAGFPEGTIIETFDNVNTTTILVPPPPRTSTDTFTDTFPSAATDVMYPVVPLLKLEAQGAILLAPGLKLKVSAGLSAPSAAAFRIGAVYLIGANN